MGAEKEGGRLNLPGHRQEVLSLTWGPGGNLPCGGGGEERSRWKALCTEMQATSLHGGRMMGPSGQLSRGNSGWGGAAVADDSGINLSWVKRQKADTAPHIFRCGSADQFLSSQESPKLRPLTSLDPCPPSSLCCAL